MKGEPKDKPSEERLYAVMTDNPRNFGKTRLARKAPVRSREAGFWTEVRPDEVWLTDRKTAEEIVSRLVHNNPRVVRAEKAISIIQAQLEAVTPAPVQEAPDSEFEP